MADDIFYTPTHRRHSLPSGSIRPNVAAIIYGCTIFTHKKYSPSSSLRNYDVSDLPQGEPVNVPGLPEKRLLESGVLSSRK